MDVTQVLTGTSRAHLQSVVNRVGPITEAEVEAKITEAAQIHAREWNRTPHPQDTECPSQMHDWAIRHIAVNCVARDRGVVIGDDRPAHAMRTVYQPMVLQPATRTGED